MSDRQDRSGKMNRREFFALSAATAAATVGAGKALAADSRFHAIPASPLPTRQFGKTGAQVPILTFGSGSRWMMYEQVDQALEVMNRAIDSGIIYLDTAHGYGNGKSETQIGMLMPRRRKEVLIQTKIATREKDQWWSDLELSLKRMNIEYLDTCLLHSLEHEDDLEKLEVKGGPLEQLYKAKEQKLVRWAGCSGHTDGPAMAKFLARNDLDVVQMALNVATNGPFDMGFEESALPVAVKKGMGIIAMKVMGQDLIANKYENYDYATCLRYSLSLPVTSCTVGMPKPEHLTRNLEVVRNFKPLGKEEQMKLKSAAAGEIQTSFLNFMAGHQDVA